MGKKPKYSTEEVRHLMSWKMDEFSGTASISIYKVEWNKKFEVYEMYATTYGLDGDVVRALEEEGFHVSKFEAKNDTVNIMIVADEATIEHVDKLHKAMAEY